MLFSDLEHEHMSTICQWSGIDALSRMSVSLTHTSRLPPVEILIAEATYTLSGNVAVPPSHLLLFAVACVQLFDPDEWSLIHKANTIDNILCFH